MTECNVAYLSALITMSEFKKHYVAGEGGERRSVTPQDTTQVK
jgi:hypothetical protein